MGRNLRRDHYCDGSAGMYMDDGGSFPERRSGVIAKCDYSVSNQGDLQGPAADHA